MWYFPLSGLINGITLTILGLFVLARNKHSLTNITYSIFCFFISFWSYSYFLWQIAKSNAQAFFWCQMLMVGAIFVPSSYFHFITALLNKSHDHFIKKMIYLAYFLSLIFAVLNFTPFMIKEMSPKLRFLFWPTAGPVYAYFLIYFALFSIYSCYLLLNEAKKSSSSKKIQLYYTFIGSVLGYIGGATNFPLWYDIRIYPVGNIVMSIYVGIVAYAILRYRLMDISIALTRTSIFVAVYTLVLGIPFAVALMLKLWLIGVFNTGWWVVPMTLMAVLATVGPFIYIYLERKAEARLLKEQKRYQDTLRQASIGMTRIRNLRKLLDLITHIVTKTVRISYAAIYLHDRESGSFGLAVKRAIATIALPRLKEDNALIKFLAATGKPLIHDEARRQMANSLNGPSKDIIETLKGLHASVVIPSFLEDRLLGFIVLGEKISGQIYTPDDLNVFQVLASQAALAIENAQFYEETKQMQEQIAQAEKMATIGTMADGLSHQINNRFYALSLITGDTVDTLKMTDTSQCSPEIKEMLKQINHALDRIQVNVTQGGEVVRGILKYSRKGDESLDALTLDQVIDGTLSMVQYKVRLSEIDIIRNYPKELPKIKGNLVQLQEVFFNFIDNAYDAMNERKAALNEEGYRGTITIHGQPSDSTITIIVEDNGMGVQEENIRKLFTPFFTTKVSSRRGTGLGLYVINKIITDTHKGKIAFESVYKKGTKFTIQLPAA